MFLFDLTKGFFNVFRRNKKEGILERNGFIVTVGERFKNCIFPVGKYYFKVRSFHSRLKQKMKCHTLSIENSEISLNEIIDSFMTEAVIIQQPVH